MKNFVVKIATLSLLLVFFVPQASIAQTEDDLSNVTFEGYGPGKRYLRMGTAAAWELLKPHAAEHGMLQFPKSVYWGFGDAEAAAKHTGTPLSLWRQPGYAVPGRAYFLFQARPHKGQLGTIAHEAVHLVQYEMTRGRSGSYCIFEGAAEWYGWKVSDTEAGRSMDKAMRELSGVARSELEFNELISRQQFRSAGLKSYHFCMYAFDLMLNIEGGQEAGTKAYLNYLSELRNTDWRTAFNRAFSEDLNTFQERFDLYRESRFKEWRFPEEIERERRENFIKELLDKITNCTPMQLRNRVCIQ